MNIVFSFDDGRDDAYDAYLVLKKHNLIGSFHITTGFVDGTFDTDDFGCGRKPVSINHLIEMHNNRMDVSSHGDKHILSNEDFATSISKLLKYGIKKKRYGFSVPNSDYSNEKLVSFINCNKDLISYIRVGRSPKCYSFFNKINYVLYHLFHFQCAFNLFNKSNLLIEAEQFRVYSLVVLSDTKVNNLIKFINKYKKTNYTLVLMFHSIVSSPSNKWEYSIGDFEKLCCFVSNNCNNITLEELTKQ